MSKTISYIFDGTFLGFLTVIFDCFQNKTFDCKIVENNNIQESLCLEYINIETDENILVQGIIDLYYISEDNKLILIDYKTDYVKKPEELINKYKTQLSIYKKALENSLNRRVDETYIFSTNWGQSLNVPFDQFGTAL